MIKPMEIDTAALQDVKVECKEGWTDSEVTESEYEGETKKKKKRTGLYFCSRKDCSAKFNRLDRLICHEMIHTGERPFVCLYNDCSKSYSRASHLKRHTQDIHEKDDKVLLECPKKGCNKLFKTRTTLKKHTKNYHEKRKYVCQTCFKHFKKNQHLKIHEYEHTGIKPYPCQHEGCDKRFVLPSKLKCHMKTHKGYKCDKPGCDAVFSTWTLLVRHKQIVHPVTYKCNICGRSFCSRYSLQSHIKIHDTEREKFYCPIKNCSKYYMHERNVIVHIKSYHKGREFACFHKDCNAKFSHKVSLRRHLEIHHEDFTQMQETRTKENKKKRQKEKKKKRKVKECSVASYLSGYASPKHETDVDPPRPCVVYLENDDGKDIDSSMIKKEPSDETLISCIEVENQNDSTNNTQEAWYSMTKYSERDSVETTPLVKVKFLEKREKAKDKPNLKEE